MSMKIKFKSIAQITAGFIILTLAACSGNKKEKAAADSDAAVLVTVATPSAATQQGLNLSGQIEASQTASISTRIMGFITMLKVKVGDPVAKGQLLVSISSQDIIAKRRQIDAMIAEAQANVSSAQKISTGSLLYTNSKVPQQKNWTMLPCNTALPKQDWKA